MSRIRDYKRIKSPNSILNRVQDKIEDAFSAFIRNPLLDGRLIRSVDLTAGQSNLIEHKLERNLRGYVITLKDANSIIWDLQTANSQKNKFLDLNCSADVKVDVWVF